MVDLWATRGMTIAKRLDYYTYHEPMSGCWLWLGGVSSRGGYAYVYINGESFRAHRIQWERFNGPIPKGMLICHHCDTPSCINPDHLFLGTHTDNMRDAVRKGRIPKAKITEKQVIEILSMNDTYRNIAVRYGVAESTIGDIKTSRTWKHLAL